MALAAAAAVLGLLYLAARETSLFAVRTLEISGAPPAVRAEVGRAADAYLGTSLVSLDGDELRRRLEALSTVRSLRYDRAFPHTLRLVVVPEEAAAVVRAGGGAWLVSRRGRVIREVPRTGFPRLPRIRVRRASPVPGTVLDDGLLRRALVVVSRIPSDFPEMVRRVQTRDVRLTLVLAGGAEIRLGGRSALVLKLAAAARVLASLSPQERSELGYLDLAVPDHPVAAYKSQVSG
jgi:cell division protein FtsQ